MFTRTAAGLIAILSATAVSAQSSRPANAPVQPPAGSAADSIATSGRRLVGRGPISLPAEPREDVGFIFAEAVPRLVVGQTFTFAVAIVGSDGRRTPESVRWESSEPQVAVVTQRGRVRALRAGRTMVVAAIEGREVRVRLTVLDPPSSEPKIASIELLPSSVSLDQGQSLQFALTARLDNGAVSPEVTARWLSSDTTLARISADGLLLARRTGTVIVSASAGGHTARASVRIVPSPVEQITINPGALAMAPGDTVVLAVTGRRRDGSAMKPDEITVRARRGLVRGTTYIAPAVAGTDTITASAADGVEFSVEAAVTAPAPPVVAVGPSVALRVERFDNADSTVLVSNGVPLVAGALKAADIDKVRIVVAGREVAARVVALRGEHKDGSLRSVLIQFMAPRFTAPMAASLELGAKPTLRRADVVAPVGAPVAVALPASPDYLIATGIVGPTIRVDEVTGSDFTQWQNDFVSFGDAHWLTSDVNGGTNYRGDNYYDRVLNHYAFWVRGGGSKWFRRASLYATSYVAKENLAWQPHFAQMEGVQLHYWLTGYERSLSAIGSQAAWMMSAFPTKYISPGGEYQEGRIQARVLMVFAIASELGLSGTMAAPGGTKWDFKAGAKGAIDAIIASQRADGRRDGVECGRDFPFMASLVNNALIFYFERIERDQRLPGLIKSNLDYLWNADWLPRERAFKYWDAPTPGGTCNVNNSGSSDAAAPDLNLMVVVPYGWYGKTFNSPEYIRRGEAIFTGATGRTAVNIAKQFNQQYYLTHSYLYYRR